VTSQKVNENGGAGWTGSDLINFGESAVGGKNLSLEVGSLKNTRVSSFKRKCARFQWVKKWALDAVLEHIVVRYGGSFQGRFGMPKMRKI